MATPRFVHLRMHSEYSVSDGIVRIDDAVKRAAADGMPALALTDSANLFGMVKFYGAARAAGVKPIIGADCWVAEPRRPRQALSACCSFAPRAPGYLRLCDASVARLAAQPVPRAGRDLARLAGRRHRGPDRAFRGPAGDARLQALPSGPRRDRRTACARLGELFPGPLLPRGAARGPAATARRCVARSVGARRAAAAAGGGDASGAVPRRRRLQGARGARLHRAGLRPRRPAPAEALHGRAVLQDARRKWRELFADLPQALENSVEIARRCNLQIKLGKTRLPAFPTPPGVTIDEHLSNEAEAGLARRFAGARLERRRQAALSRAPRVRDPDHRADGLRRLLPDRRRLHQLGEDATACPSVPGRGSGAGSLVAYSLGITDLDPLRYDLCSSASSIPSACRCPTSTSTSARTGATA